MVGNRIPYSTKLESSPALPLITKENSQTLTDVEVEVRENPQTLTDVEVEVRETPKH